VSFQKGHFMTDGLLNRRVACRVIVWERRLREIAGIRARRSRAGPGSSSRLSPPLPVACCWRLVGLAPTRPFAEGLVVPSSGHPALSLVVCVGAAGPKQRRRVFPVGAVLVRFCSCGGMLVALLNVPHRQLWVVGPALVTDFPNRGRRPSCLPAFRRRFPASATVNSVGDHRLGGGGGGGASLTIIYGHGEIIAKMVITRWAPVRRAALAGRPFFRGRAAAVLSSYILIIGVRALPLDRVHRMIPHVRLSPRPRGSTGSG